MLEKSRLRDMLDWSDGTSAFENDLLKKAERYSEIIIFGAGIGGQMTYELLVKNGLGEKIKAFSDNNQDKIGGTYLGNPVIAPEMIEIERMQLILVSSTAFDIISEQLTGLGIKADNIYYFQPAGISLERNSDMEFIRENIDRLEAVYEQLADEKSHKLYRSLLNYRITKQRRYLEEIKDSVDREENQYFDEEILRQYSFTDGFVDAGAYVGDTIASFFNHFPEYKGSYYCIEAGGEVYERLCENISKMNLERIYTYKYAVWDEGGGKLKFDTNTFGNGGGSRVSDEGETVDCNSLDNLLSEKSIDFIKMDIEGAEKKGLLGARKVIERNKPILAICVYHKREDFFDIAETIQNVVSGEYTFYIRQYRYGQSETVLYAMPKSRRKK